ncbi:MAG: RHS repeat-associated core domain-containing protein, partial [Chthoniobacteraceae bacterium]
VVVARYDLGPFGEPLRATGPMAQANPFRFSTKYTDSETGLLYYGYRYYQPQTGRWMSRDPIGERGSIGLQTFVNNQPLTQTDSLGLEAKTYTSIPIPDVTYRDDEPPGGQAAEGSTRGYTEFDYELIAGLDPKSPSGKWCFKIDGHLAVKKISVWKKNARYQPLFPGQSGSTAEHEKRHVPIALDVYNAGAKALNTFDGICVCKKPCFDLYADAIRHMSDAYLHMFIAAGENWDAADYDTPFAREIARGKAGVEMAAAKKSIKEARKKFDAAKKTCRAIGGY